MAWFEMSDGVRVNMGRILDRLSVGPGGCWLWEGATDRGGHGKIMGRKSDGRITTSYIHRAMYECHFGPIPTGLYVIHECDMPNCANPSHLRCGTQEDNIRGGLKRGRPIGRPRGTHCNRGHKFIEQRGRNVCLLCIPIARSIRKKPGRIFE